MFASWSAGEYGSVGATEWLEVRLAHLMKRRATALGCSKSRCWRVLRVTSRL